MTNDDYYDNEQQRKRNLPETYEERLERWKEEWARELDDDLANGR